MPDVEKVSRVKPHAQYFRQDGHKVPSVTTVLGELNKPALVIWANRLGLQGIDSRRYVDALATIGTLAHYMIQCHLRGEAPVLTSYSPEQIDKAENSVLKFFEWQKHHKIEPVRIEAQMVSEEHSYGGTLDCLAIMDGVLTIGDWKTAKAIYDEHLFQAAAYWHLARENGYDAKAIRILQIGRTEEEGFTERVVSDAQDVEKYWLVFYHALQIYNLKQQIKEAV